MLLPYGEGLWAYFAYVSRVGPIQSQPESVRAFGWGLSYAVDWNPRVFFQWKALGAKGVCWAPALVKDKATSHCLFLFVCFNEIFQLLLGDAGAWASEKISADRNGFYASKSCKWTQRCTPRLRCAVHFLWQCQLRKSPSLLVFVPAPGRALLHPGGGGAGPATAGVTHFAELPQARTLSQRKALMLGQFSSLRDDHRWLCLPQESFFLPDSLPLGQLTCPGLCGLTRRNADQLPVTWWATALSYPSLHCLPYKVKRHPGGGMT